jgi:hypothetical protein
MYFILYGIQNGKPLAKYIVSKKEKVKLKQSYYRSGQALKVSGV